MMPLTETSRIGLETIWTLFRDAWLRGHEPNADRMCCSMDLLAYRQMAWGAYLCTRNDDAYELYDHIAAVEHAYWLRDPHLDWYARQHHEIACDDQRKAQVEQYMAWLVAIDDEIGKLRGHMEAMEYARKLTRSKALLDADHKSSELRMAYAESRPEYKTACEAHADAVARSAGGARWNGLTRDCK